MTVADLIARLRDYPGDAVVVTPEGIRNVPIEHTWTAEYEADSGEPVPAVVIL